MVTCTNTFVHTWCLWYNLTYKHIWRTFSRLQDSKHMLCSHLMWAQCWCVQVLQEMNDVFCRVGRTISGESRIASLGDKCLHPLATLQPPERQPNECPQNFRQEENVYSWPSPFTRTSCRDQSFVSSPKYELKKVFIVRLTFSAPTKMEFPLVKVVPPSFIFHSHPLIFLFRPDRRTIQHKRGYNTICFCQSGLFHGPGCALSETIIHKRERREIETGSE